MMFSIPGLSVLAARLEIVFAAAMWATAVAATFAAVVGGGARSRVTGQRHRAAPQPTVRRRHARGGNSRRVTIRGAGPS